MKMRVAILWLIFFVDWAQNVSSCMIQGQKAKPPRTREKTRKPPSDPSMRIVKWTTLLNRSIIYKWNGPKIETLSIVLLKRVDWFTVYLSSSLGRSSPVDFFVASRARRHVFLLLFFWAVANGDPCHSSNSAEPSSCAGDKDKCLKTDGTDCGVDGTDCTCQGSKKPFL